PVKIPAVVMSCVSCGIESLISSLLKVWLWGTVHLSSGVTSPESKAAAKVTALPVDPGSNACDSAVVRQKSESVSEGSVGSTVSESDKANISPDLASITTMFPHSALYSSTLEAMASCAYQETS